jgi:glutaredoxin
MGNHNTEHGHEHHETAHPNERKMNTLNKCIKSCKRNPWRLIAGVLAVILVVVLFVGNPITGKVISSKEVGQKIIDFANAQGAEAELVKVNDDGNFYEVILSIQGQEFPLYVTKDGKSFTQTLIPLSGDVQNNANQQVPSQTQTQTNIPKSDKPKVELFVMSHCPYGTQMEKGILPVAKKLQDNIDFEIKFVNYAMHPTQGEVEEQLNQYCIQRDYNDKYLNYLGKFLEAGDGEKALSAVGLSQSDISKCVEETDKKFDVIKNLEDKSSWSSGRFPKFMIYDADNQKYGVQGSPTLVINGQQAQSGRDAQSILNTICSAFTTKPEECNTDMTSFGNPAPGFGFDTQGGSATAAGCGA